MNIIHFSDLHYSFLSVDQTKLFTIKPLINTLMKINQENTIDLILFTGDLIDKGGDSFDSADEAFMKFYDDVLNPICTALDLNENRFIICPGNHDIERNLDGDISEKGCLATFTSEAVVTDFIDKIKNGKTKDGAKRIEKYKAFEEIVYGDSDNHYLTYFESAFRFKIDGKSIGVVALNSSWRCFNNTDSGNLIIGEKQLIDSLKFLEDCDYKIAISHHNTEDLIPYDKALVEKLLMMNFELLMSGHVHSSSNKYVIEPKGKLITLVAPGTLVQNSATDSKAYSNGFSSVLIDFLNGKLKATFYTYHYADKEYTLNTNISADGCWLIDLPQNENLLKDITKRKIISSIIEEQLQKIDTSLLTFSTDTDAPKCLKEIFVLPKLLLKEDISKEKEVELGDLETILKSNSNYLFFGTKESGKTTLLNKILFDAVDSANPKTKIPVYIDYYKISNDIVSNVRDYILASKEATKDALTKQHFVILIDNLTTSNKFEDILKIKQIEKLVEDYPNTQIVGSYNIQFEGQIPEYISLLDKLKFKTVTIQEFQSKQIRALTSKWFAGSNLIDKPKKIETIINGFLALSLPRTPFTVSMFLWIIEKQQNFKPINNSTLIETFIEKLLNKHSLSEILSEKFDYRNKIRLLSELSYKMLHDDRENYSDTHANVVQFISKYLEKKEFDYNVEVILNDLIDSGILIKEENNIRFRFSCFFEYFLVVKMGYDKNFKEYVLRPENYLKFTNEIDYFTGLNRDDADILKLAVERLDKVFEGVIRGISSLEPTVDDFFKQKVSQINIKEDEVAEFIPHQKATEIDHEELEDRQLSSQKPENGIKKKNEVSVLEAIGTNLILSLKILKNCEEVEEDNLKFNSYKKILNCSVYFAIFYKIYVSQLIAHRLIPEKEKNSQIEILQFLPANHVNLLARFMGTQKLSSTYLKKINEDNNNDDISEFEKFQSVFLYAEVRGKEYFEKLNDFIVKANKKYIFDNAFVKMLNYYSFRSKDAQSDLKYLNMIADILIKAKGFKKESKSDIMLSYKTKTIE